jgi:RNA polymerase sigma-32 factor
MTSSESLGIDLPAAGDGVNRYLRTVRGLRPLSREEELALVERWRNHGDLAARRVLLTANLRSVAAIAFKYRRYGVLLDDLIAEGNLALVHALKKFDPRRGTRFMTYASFWVRAYVLDHVIGSFSMVSSGSAALRSRHFFKLRRERAKLLGLIGDSEQTDAVLAKSLDLRVDQVRSMVRRLETRDVSVDADADGSVLALVERLCSDEPSHEDRLANLELARQVRSTIERVLATLDDRERFIAEARLLADGEDQPSLAELGKQLGVSRERVRQLEERTKLKLRPSFESHAREAGYPRRARAFGRA